MCKNIFARLCLFAGILAAAAVTSCATVNGQRTYRVYVTNTKRIPLLPPNGLTAPVDGLYRISTYYNKNRYLLLGYITGDDTQLTIELLSDMGLSVGTVSYTDGNISMTAGALPAAYPSAYLIWDLQNIFYDASRLAAQYAAAGLSFTETEPGPEAGDTKLRAVTHGKRTLATVRYDGNGITLHNRLRNYIFKLTEAEQ